MEAKEYQRLRNKVVLILFPMGLAQMTDDVLHDYIMRRLEGKRKRKFRYEILDILDKELFRHQRQEIVVTGCFESLLEPMVWGRATNLGKKYKKKFRGELILNNTSQTFIKYISK